jgi:hypothetical protein
VIVGACGSNRTTGFADAGGGGDGSVEASSGSDSGGGSSSSGGSLFDGALGDAEPAGGDPTTCAEAAMGHTYIGCDYWPTVTGNDVWSLFDFAVVVANAGSSTADITVTGPNSTMQTGTVAPGQLTTFYLPWVPSLKGPDSDNCGALGGGSVSPDGGGTFALPFLNSVFEKGGAYHLVSTVPVTVYQFSALEYLPRGGPAGKDWSNCPGDTICMDPFLPAPVAIGCYAYSNDASLLLPSTALTGNVRITGHESQDTMNTYVAITATADNTTVKMKVSSAGKVLPSATTGDGGAAPVIAATPAGGMLTFTMNQGDVAELVADFGAVDLSGSLVQATQPIQVITGSECLPVPDAAEACDHIEESNFPAETLGQDYFVVQPIGPNGDVVNHQARIYGNFDGTNLTYVPSAPMGCPSVINAGEVVECGGPVNMCIDPNHPAGPPTGSCGNGNVVTQDFEIKGDHAFAVSTFSLGGQIVDPMTKAPMQQGDPDQSMATAVKQYRTKYVFLAPTDYEENYAVVIAPTGTVVTIDGVASAATATPVGTTGFGVMRIPLAAGNAGAHVLTATHPVGLQVMGYGSYTSYTYPGGLNLAYIAPAPLQ